MRCQHFLPLIVAALSLIGPAQADDAPAVGPHNYKIKQEYDRIEDQTTLRLDLGVIWRNAENELELKIAKTFRGKGRSIPDGDPRLLFMNDGKKGWRYLEYHPVTFLVDNERIRFEPDHDGRVGDGYVLEFLTPDLSGSQFQALVNAKSVEIRVGIDEVHLDPARMNALRDFASYASNPDRLLSVPEARRRLAEAKKKEVKFLDGEAIVLYQKIVDEHGGTAEAAEATKAIKVLSDPERKEVRRKAIEARELAEAARKKELFMEARAQQKRIRASVLRSMMSENLRLAMILEKRNTKGAITYYKEIIAYYEELTELTAPSSTDDEQVKTARSRIKALEALGR